MASFSAPSAARLGALGLVLALSSACASMPSPVSGPGAPPWRAPSAAIPEPRILESGPPLQCVPFARQASGVEIYGDAYTWWALAEGRYPRSSRPAPGSVLVLRGFSDAQRGHVAVVTAILSSREIRVDQANWLNRGEVTLSVPVRDVSAANDWSAVQVWHIPGGHWGGRTYLAEGFIHAFGLVAGS